MKGWIALDIDGTITEEKYDVPQRVIDYLRSLEKMGWQIALATGRSFRFGSLALSKFDFPFVFLVQNGSAALQMPDKKLIFKRYLDPSILPVVEKSLEGHCDFLVYAGFEKGDFCYWRPEGFSEKNLRYAEAVHKRENEVWRSVGSFDASTIESVSLVKCIGTADSMAHAAERLRAAGGFQVVSIRDPFEAGFQILLVTDKRASKGLSLKEVMRLKGRGGKVIAAGDDENDISMFDEADFKIAMPHAPETVRRRADLIAPPTRSLGIIAALEEAVK